MSQLIRTAEGSPGGPCCWTTGTGGHCRPGALAAGFELTAPFVGKRHPNADGRPDRSRRCARIRSCGPTPSRSCDRTPLFSFSAHALRDVDIAGRGCSDEPRDQSGRRQPRTASRSTPARRHARERRAAPAFPGGRHFCPAPSWRGPRSPRAFFDRFFLRQAQPAGTTAATPALRGCRACRCGFGLRSAPLGPVRRRPARFRRETSPWVNGVGARSAERERERERERAERVGRVRPPPTGARRPASQPGGLGPLDSAARPALLGAPGKGLLSQRTRAGRRGPIAARLLLTAAPGKRCAGGLRATCDAPATFRTTATAITIR